MTVTSDIADSAPQAASKTVHPLIVRITHWINAVAIFIMIGSGWEIYNASPLFNFTFPRVIVIGWGDWSFSVPGTIGGWLAGGLQWHFAAMWVLVINGIVYVTYGFASGRFRRKLLPITPRAVVADVTAAFRGKLSHDDLAVYNSVQRLLYAGILIVGVVIVLSGLSIWKPVQLQWLTAMFGGYDAARYVHFIAMAAIVGFLVIHIVMALLVPKSLRAMIIGK